MRAFIARHRRGAACAPQKFDRGQLDQLEVRETGYGMIGA
jgi:hypothetical protein